MVESQDDAFEAVYVELDWYDGPRAGLADIDGVPHYFRAVRDYGKFAEQSTEICESISSDPGSGVCLQQTALVAAADDPKMRNVTIYLSQVGITAPSAADPATDRLREFWTATELIPASEATWFTDLVAEAKAAPKKKLG